eukprot:845793-Prymnesium_polylepis.2
MLGTHTRACGLPGRRTKRRTFRSSNRSAGKRTRSETRTRRNWSSSPRCERRSSRPLRTRTAGSSAWRSPTTP